jgi:hypothetical protein
MAGDIERLAEQLTAHRLEPLLDKLARHAELNEEQQRSFKVWAGAMLERLVHPSHAGLAGYREALESVRQEFRAVHSGVAAAWLTQGHIDEELVCRRALLGHLIDLVEPLVGAEPHRGRIVKAAA